MSYRSLLIIILVFVFTQSNANIFNGMTANLGRAFGRLSRAGPKPFALLPGLRLAPTSEWNASVAKTTTTSRPKGPTLIDSVTNVLKTHRLEWVIGPGLQVSLYADDKGLFKIKAGNDNATQDTSRTFGVMRRMKLAILPIMYKLGVITTLLVLLTAFALKGLTIGVILIVMTSVGFISKLHFGHYGPDSAHKEVHVHVHGGHGGYHHSAWDRAEGYGYLPHPPSTASPWAQYIFK